jgi:hypothetical protein
MGNPTRPQPPPPQAAAPPAQQPPPPPLPPPPQQDGATLIQEQLDKLALACFNAVLEVTKARAGDGGGGGSGGGAQLQEQQRTKVGGGWVVKNGGRGWAVWTRSFFPSLSHTALLITPFPLPLGCTTQVSEIGVEIGTLLREMEEAIDGLPVIPSSATGGEAR